MISTRSSRNARKNSAFRTVFFWQLKRNRMGAMFYTVALLGCLPVIQLILAVAQADYYLDLSNWGDGQTMEDLRLMFSQYLASAFNDRLVFLLIPLSLAFVVGYCMVAFGFMHGRRSVDLFHAMPIRRTPLFLGSFAAGLVYLYVPMALSFALTQCVGLAYGLPAPFSGAMIWQAFVLCDLMLTAVYTSCLFFYVCSGTLLDAAISILALNLGWPLLCLCVYTTVDMTLPGYCYEISTTLATAFSPCVAAFLPTGMATLSHWSTGIDSVVYYDVSQRFVAWWVALALIFLGSALLYYNHRKSECAEDHFSAPLVRGVLRFLVSAASGLGVGLVVGSILNSNLAFFVGIVVGSAIAHVASQVLWTHTLRRFWQTLPAYGLMLGCVCVFLFGLSQGGFGFVNRVPAADKVASATFEPSYATGDDSREIYLLPYSNFNVYTEDYGTQVSIKPVLKETTDIQTLCAYHDAVVSSLKGPFLPFEKETDNIYTAVTYNMKDGSTVRRKYYVPKSQEIKDAELRVVQLDHYDQYSLFPYYTVDQVNGVDFSLISENAQFEACMTDDSDMALTQAEKEALWTTFISELNSKEFKSDVKTDTNVQTAVVDPQSQLKDQKLPEKRAEGEALFGEANYCFYLNDLEIKNLPSFLQAFIREACESEEQFQELTYAGGEYTLTIPKSCTKTRDMIYTYGRERGVFYDYSNGDD